MAGDYSINDIYQGGYSSLSPSYGNVFSGYMVKAGSLGITTDPRTANVLQDVSSKLATGAKQIELSAVSPEVFESIPKQHLKEINRLSKLTGVDVSVHAPIVEASGITKEGFSESNRESAERQMNSAIERSHEVNPNGNVPVTFHSSAIIPQPVKPKGKELEEAFVINSETGSISKIPLRKRKFPGEGELSIKNELKNINENQWSSEIRNMSYYADMGEKAVKNHELIAKTLEAEKKAGKETTPMEKEAESSFNLGTTFLNDSYRQLKNLFEMAQRQGSDEDKKILDDFANKIDSKVSQIKQARDIYESAQLRREIIDEGVKVFEKITPEINKPLDDFARKKTTETFSNVALNSFNKFKDKAPIISIENPPVGGAFSTGKELKEIVEKSREKFVEKAVAQGMSESEATTQAEKLLGVTWDIGHINMLRKYGYQAEDIVKETEEVAPLVKHIHLSDNFGFEHTELPMGMGNVPMKEIMEKLPEKDVKKIIEAGNWWQHFKTAPFQATLEAVGSPIYSMNMAPYWNQTQGLEQGYFSGYGQMLPSINYETFGAGFSQLPMELGGQRPGAQGGRMSGKPME